MQKVQTQTKTSQVCAALAACKVWYAVRKENIRLLTERTEALWFQIDDLVWALQEAEERGDTAETERHLQALTRCALILQAEVHSVRVKSRQ